MNTPKSYADLVSQAEAAVSAVKDAELRRVAFEKILDDLLLTASGPSIHSAGADARSTTRTIHTQKQKTPSRPPTKRTGPQAYVEELVEEGFFAKQKTISEVKVELGNCDFGSDSRLFSRGWRTAFVPRKEQMEADKLWSQKRRGSSPHGDNIRALGLIHWAWRTTHRWRDDWLYPWRNAPLRICDFVSAAC